MVTPTSQPDADGEYAGVFVHFGGHSGDYRGGVEVIVLHFLGLRHVHVSAYCQKSEITAGKIASLLQAAHYDFYVFTEENVLSVPPKFPPFWITSIRW